MKRASSAALAAKIAGYKSLKELAELERRSVSTLQNWYNNEPKLWKAAIERNRK